jgi:hypothetical protein
MQDKFGENAIWVYEVLRYVIDVLDINSLYIGYTTAVSIGMRVSFLPCYDNSPDFFCSQREGKSQQEYVGIEEPPEAHQEYV